MRNTFINTLQTLTRDNDNIFLITGDLGYGVLDKYIELYPENYINAGISEQNMTSIAAGMALEGKIVFTYSIANFPTLRCMEQIRNDCTYHDANVKIVSIGAGLAYGGAGMSHHATEDIAIMRALPQITVFSPCDPIETEKVIKATVNIPGTCYIRLGKGGENYIHNSSLNFKVGKAIKVKSGEGICIFSTGAITYEAKQAVEELEKEGINVALYSFHTIKPIDETTIIECANTYKCIITLEEHNIIGGFGGAVAEVISEMRGEHAYQKRLGLRDVYSSVVGSQCYLRKCYSIDKESIKFSIKEILLNEE